MIDECMDGLQRSVNAMMGDGEQTMIKEQWDGKP
jgi:hypothetical protein